MEHGPEKAGLPVDRHMTYIETLIHLLKGNVGAGLFAMGDAFKNSGTVVGFAGTIFIGIICIYNNHTLIRCARAIMAHKGLDSPPTFPDTICYSFEFGPSYLKILSTQMKRIVKIFILITQLGFCVVYIAFVAQSLKDMVEHHVEGIHWNIRVYMAFIFPIITFASLIRTLKFMTPVSFISNVCLIYGVFAIFVVIAQDTLLAKDDRKLVQHVDRWPLFIGTVIFAFEGIALTIPLHNEMKKNELFDSTFGVLNVGMSIMMMLLLSLGFLSYLRYGEEINGSVTFNLSNDPLPETVRGAVGLGIMLTYPLQFYVAAKIINLDIEDKWGPFRHDCCIESSERLALIIITFIIAAVVPHVDAVISLIGAVCSNALALLLPALADICLRCGNEPIFKANWLRTVMNFVAILLSIVGATTGAYVSIKNIVELFVKEITEST